MTATSSPLSEARLNELEQRVRRLESVLGMAQPDGENLTRVKALIKNGSNAFFNGKAKNPHAPGSREYELWQYGADLARDISVGAEQARQPQQPEQAGQTEQQQQQQQQ